MNVLLVLMPVLVILAFGALCMLNPPPVSAYPGSKERGKWPRVVRAAEPPLP